VAALFLASPARDFERPILYVTRHAVSPVGDGKADHRALARALPRSLNATRGAPRRPDCRIGAGPGVPCGLPRVSEYCSRACWGQCRWQAQRSALPRRVGLLLAGARPVGDLGPVSSRRPTRDQVRPRHPGAASVSGTWRGAQRQAPAPLRRGDSRFLGPLMHRRVRALVRSTRSSLLHERLLLR